MIENDTTIVQEAVVVPVKERIVETGINIIEDRIPTPISDYSISDSGLTFTNRDGYTYYAPMERLHNKEPKDRSRFLINKGHYFLLDKGRKSHILRYEKIDTTRKEIHLNLTRENEKQIVLPYEIVDVDLRSIMGGKIGEIGMSGVSQGFNKDMTYDDIVQINPDITIEQYADSKTIGKAILDIDGWRFDVFIGYKAGNPIVVDLNGDRHVDGAETKVHTKSDEEHELKGI